MGPQGNLKISPQGLKDLKAFASLSAVAMSLSGSLLAIVVSAVHAQSFTPGVTGAISSDVRDPVDQFYRSFAHSKPHNLSWTLESFALQIGPGDPLVAGTYFDFVNTSATLSESESTYEARFCRTPT